MIQPSVNLFKREGNTDLNTTTEDSLRGGESTDKKHEKGLSGFFGFNQSADHIITGKGKFGMEPTMSSERVHENYNQIEKPIHKKSNSRMASQQQS